MKPQRWFLSLLLILTVLAGCSKPPAPPQEPVSHVGVYEANGIKQVTTVKDGHLAWYDGKEWRTQFWPGVNLGATMPGHAPGELVPRKADYRRWFPQMKALNAKVLRIYTILPPEFYEAFAEFNATQTEPLWLIQGIWSPEEELIGEAEQGNDAYLPAITERFQREIADAIDVVYGKAEIAPRPGHASGTYRTDVSRYLLGWLVGTEWHQMAVKKTIDAHPNMAPYQGTYFSAKSGAHAFESWLARMLDHAATLEMKHGWQHPMAFTNWATTDPLPHPDEANPNEDLVSVDPMKLEPTAAWKAGYYAAYHIYPYYPDFIRYEEGYARYVNSDGKPDPYAGYLHALRSHHRGIPFIVAEYGVPSSRGLAHKGGLDRNQGYHTEAEMGEINADMTRQIHAEGYDGAILFAFHDEWHKFTWNTVGLEQPSDRRPIWRNRLTNEEHFGLIAVEASSAAEQIYLDGKTDDWSRNRNRVEQSYDDLTLTVTHDEAYLYLLAKKKAGSWDFTRESFYAGFTTLGGGSKTADKAPGLTFSQPLEFLLKLQGENGSAIYVSSAYDQHTWQYGFTNKQLPYYQPTWSDPAKGSFLPWKLMLNRPLTMRQSGRQIPAEEFEVGLLKPGSTDPNAPGFNSLADWYAAGDLLEIRIPWMLLGFTDPSSHQVWQYPYQAGGLKSTSIAALRVEPKLVTHAAGVSRPVEPLSYTWERWDQPRYHERPKQAVPIITETFGQLQHVTKGRP